VNPRIVISLVLISVGALLFAVLQTGGDHGRGGGSARSGDSPSPVVETISTGSGAAARMEAPEPVSPLETTSATGPGRVEIQRGQGSWQNQLVGTVQDSNGLKVVGARISLKRQSVPSDLALLSMALAGTTEAPGRNSATDDRGEYSFYGLEPGSDYSLVIDHADYSRAQVGPIDIREKGVFREDVRLETGYLLEGHTYDDASGLPIAGAQMELDNPIFAALPIRRESPDRMVTLTDASGLFRFPNVSPGNRVLTVRAKGFGTQSKNNVLFQGKEKLVEQNFRLSPGMSIAGKVFAPDRTGIEGATLEAISYQSDTASRGSAVSIQGGEFLIEDVMEGAYTLIVRADGWGEERMPRVEAGDVSVMVEMNQQGSILGRVVDGRTGKPVSTFSCSIRFINPANGYYGRAAKKAGFKNRADGSFQVEGIEAGSYAVQVSARGYADTFSEPFSVTQGMATPDVIVRMSRGGSIVGRVISAKNGKPVKGAEISTHDNNWFDSPFTRILGSMSPRNTTASTVRTDDDGLFRIPLMTPEVYQVEIKHHLHTSVIKNDLHIVADQENDLGTITMRTGAKIRGTVYGPDGRVLPGATVNVNASAGGAAGRAYEARTGTDGRYEITNVAPGPYKVSSSRKSAGSGNPFGVIIDMRNSEVELELLDGREYSQDLYLGDR